MCWRAGDPWAPLNCQDPLFRLTSLHPRQTGGSIGGVLPLCRTAAGELIFKRVNNEKYSTVSIDIEHAILTLKEDYDIIKIEKTKWNYRKAVIKLNHPDLCDQVKLWEIKVNDYLKGEGVEPITILYGNKIYPKTSLTNTVKKKLNYVKVKGVWVDKNLPFPELWFE